MLSVALVVSGNLCGQISDRSETVLLFYKIGTNIKIINLGVEFTYFNILKMASQPSACNDSGRFIHLAVMLFDSLVSAKQAAV